MINKYGVSIALLSVLLIVGCVTQTERLPYHRYMPPEEESAWDEFKRTARNVKTTVSGWFSSEEEETPGSLQRWQKAQRQFKQEQQEALRRLQEKQEQEQQQQEELRRGLEKQN